MPFVDDARLVVTTGMTGATGNIYFGLHDLKDMSFTLHFLRPNDYFLDVGANIGSYSILAWLSGAYVLAFEPVAETYQALDLNIRVNDAQDKVDARNCGVASKGGVLRFTSDLECANRVVSPSGDEDLRSFEIKVVALDETLTKTPLLMKIDVEGFELDVLDGAKNLLNDPALKAIIIEINGSGMVYGKTDDMLRDRLLGAGFSSFLYDPFTRSISPTDQLTSEGNVLFIRDEIFAARRLTESRKYKVLNQYI